jgi:hypothetical protein
MKSSKTKHCTFKSKGVGCRQDGSNFQGSPPGQKQWVYNIKGNKEKNHRK